MFNRKQTPLSCDTISASDITPNSSLKSESWISSREAAEHLGLSVKTLRNWASLGLVPFCKAGRLNRFRKSELDRLLLKKKRGRSWE